MNREQKERAVVTIGLLAIIFSVAVLVSSLFTTTNLKLKSFGIVVLLVVSMLCGVWMKTEYDKLPIEEQQLYLMPSNYWNSPDLPGVVFPSDYMASSMMFTLFSSIGVVCLCFNYVSTKRKLNTPDDEENQSNGIVSRLLFGNNGWNTVLVVIGSWVVFLILHSIF